MSDRATSAIRELQRRKTEYGNGAGRHKLNLLRELERRRLYRAKDVLRLHEVLCFLRAYPDDAALLDQIERMLARFDQRSDLRRHRGELANSGIAGTSIHFSFFAATASWLARRWGEHLAIDWEDFEHQARLEQWLPLLAIYGETPGLDELPLSVRQWIEHMKGPSETDATFLLRRLDQLGMNPLIRETLLDDLDIPLHLAPGSDTPSRTREKHDDVRIAFQTRPLARRRPSVVDEVARPPRSIRALPPRQGQKLIDLARAAMATRNRDLDAFAHGDPNDVRLADCGDGLQFAYIGVVPERRLLLETLYGFLMLKNGVPVGYGTNTSLYGSSEVAYTVFDTFREGEAALMYGRMLAIAARLFGADTFMVAPYQLGEGNEDALRSGAWWFYQKLGFRPRAAGPLRLMQRELRRMKGNPSHRSSIATLRKLAVADVFLHLGRPRDDVLGLLPLANIGLRITTYVADRFGSDRRKATRVCAQEAARLLRVRSVRNWGPGELLAWQRWAPLVLILPRLKRWPRRDQAALVSVVRAKGGRRESDFILRFDRHRRLRRAIQALAGEP